MERKLNKPNQPVTKKDMADSKFIKIYWAIGLAILLTMTFVLEKDADMRWEGYFLCGIFSFLMYLFYAASK